MATKVQLNFFRATLLSIIVLSFQVHTAFNDSSKIVQHIENKSFRYGKVIESTVLRFLKEIMDRTSLVHLIAQTVDDRTDKSRETIVKTCANFRISLKLLIVEESSNDFIVRVQPRYPKIYHVLAVARNMSLLRPERWKEVFRIAWKSQGLFAIFIENEIIDKKSAEEFLKKFWQMDVSNVVLIDLKTSTSGFTKIYSYDPFNNIKDGVNGIVYQVNPTDPLFPDKLQNLKGQPISISLYRHNPRVNLTKKTGFIEATGLDVELIRYTSSKLNFTVNLVTKDVDATSHVSTLPSGRKVGPVGDIISNHSEYLGNAQFLEVLHLYNTSLDFVYPFWRARSVIVVRRASPHPAFFNLIGKADPYIFYIGNLSMLLFYLYLRFFRKSNNRFLTILGLILFQNLRKIGNKSYDRIFCYAYIFYSCVICTIYQGYLVHDLTAPPIFPNIDTLTELADKKLTLMVRPYEMRLLLHTNNEIKKRLAKIAMVELNFSDCVRRMIKSKSIACAIDEGYGKYALSRVRKEQLDAAHMNGSDGKAEPAMHIVKESLTGFWQCYMVRKGFPYLEQINDAMERTMQFGLIRKWLREDKRKRFHEPEESKEVRALGLLHLDYIFSILIIGHIISSLVFLLEIIFASNWMKNFGRKIRLVARIIFVDD